MRQAVVARWQGVPSAFDQPDSALSRRHKRGKNMNARLAVSDLVVQQNLLSGIKTAARMDFCIRTEMVLRLLQPGGRCVVPVPEQRAFFIGPVELPAGQHAADRSERRQ